MSARHPWTESDGAMYTRMGRSRRSQRAFSGRITVVMSTAVILPAAPAFYHKPATIEDLVDTVLARALDHLGLPEHPVGRRWREM